MRNGVKVLAVLLAAIMSLGMITATALATGSLERATDAADGNQSLYDKINIGDITREGGDPPEISGAASALAVEKEWYEYLTYSEQPISSYRLTDDRRLVFYDPYNYSDAMLMEVTGQDADWSTANSISVSVTTSKSYSWTKGSGTSSDTSVQVQDGRDINYGYTKGTSASTTKGWSSTKSKTESDTQGKVLSRSIAIEVGYEAPAGWSASGTFTVSRDKTKSSTVENGFSVSGNGSIGIGSNESTTEGWSTVANRITTSTGSSTSTSSGWSTSSSKTVTRTFNATHFSANGSPLSWKIVQYTVYMPLKYDLQCRIDGEWVTTDSSYCLLTTIEGTCRSWIQNDVVYLEHWGTGQPVQWANFWRTFFTKEDLVAAYSSKLYPDS